MSQGAPRPERRDGLHSDWHCHSTWSDGQDSPAHLAALAARRGVTLGISDHALLDNRRLRAPADFSAYDAELAAQPVLRGVEISVGDLDNYGGTATDELLEQLHYVIASLHIVRIPEGTVHAARYHNFRAGLYPGYPPSVPRYDRSRYFATWLRLLEATCRRWPVKILGHFCLLPEQATRSQSFDLATDPEPDATAARFLDDTIAVCNRYAVAIELNSKSRVPHRSFVERALALGARFSLGSDAHQARRAGDLAHGRDLARRLRIPPDRFLTPADVLP